MQAADMSALYFLHEWASYQAVRHGNVQGFLVGYDPGQVVMNFTISPLAPPSAPPCLYQSSAACIPAFRCLPGSATLKYGMRSAS